MTVAYTNRKGRTYYLCQGVTKTGKLRYYFARQPKGEPVDKIPPGYRVVESVNGVVSLAKERPQLIKLEETRLVEGEITRNPKAENFRVDTKHDRIEIYELVGPSTDELVGNFEKMGFPMLGSMDALRATMDQYSQYTAVMRFTLVDPEKRLFRAERWCYFGSVDDWIDIDYGQIDEMAPELIAALGTDEFFNLHWGGRL